MEEELQQNGDYEGARIEEFRDEYSGVDQGYLIFDQDGYQHLLVRSGNRMETVTYYGEADIESRADEVIADVLH